MTRSDHLRQALDGSEYGHDDEGVPYIKGPLCFAFRSAARCWLRLQEGDEQLVEKVARVLQQGFWKVTTTVDRPLTEGHLFAKARAVLAAIVGEET